MSRVDFVASQEHWIDHLAPVWKALKPVERGKFYVPTALLAHAGRIRLKATDLPAWPKWGPYTVVASESDRGRINHGGVIRFEHGAGFSFGAGMTQKADRHPSYAGGVYQSNVVMFLNPNHWANDRWKMFYPHIPAHIVGSPKLDSLPEVPPKTGKPVVALTFHWDCMVCPETRSAFKFYRSAIDNFLARTDIEIIGHCHPRGRREMKPWFMERGMEFVDHLEDVFERTDLYLNDSSSTLYEFAATDRPVVVLNAPWYRQEIRHGLRFWDCADVGPNVWEPADLNRIVDNALEDHPARAQRRAEITAEVFPFIGSAAKEAAKRIREFIA